MKYIFSVIGGSGSTYLIDKLSEKFIVGDKPDTIFHPIISMLNLKK